MAANNINRVTLTANLTFDPELRTTHSGTSVCKLRVASTTRRKDATGTWVEKPNYFDVTVWGAHGEACARYLTKGRPVAIDGRLEWNEWHDEHGNKRQAVQIVADTVQFLGTGNAHPDTPSPPPTAAPSPPPAAAAGAVPASDIPADFSDVAPVQPPAAQAVTGDEDIPF